MSITTPYILILENQGKGSGLLLRRLKAEINRSLAAILTLNTIAHTIGAAGVGAQATQVFGNASIGIVSAVLTLLILIFSEIIPKSLGAHYWRHLAPATAYLLQGLIIILYPFVLLSEKITDLLATDTQPKGFDRSEFAAMAEIGEKEGKLAEQESRIIRNLFLLRETRVADVMTPRPVVFSLAEELTVTDFFQRHESIRFSRIPIYQGDPDKVTGFVLKDDLLLAQAKGHGDHPLPRYRRTISLLTQETTLADAFEAFLDQRAQIMLAMDEYGGTAGIITLEDILETLLGLEIVDESDKTPDMRKLAQRLWRKRAHEMGLQIDDSDD